MHTSDLAIAWTSKNDAPFVELLDESFRNRGMSLLQITDANRHRVIEGLQAGDDSFRALLDRASDENPEFQPLATWAAAHDVLRINPQEESVRAADKAAMHFELFEEVRTPYTLILPPFSQSPEIGPLDLSPLGATFTSKPAKGGGGEGVFVLCTSVEDIQTARRVFPDDRYILQARVVPARIDGRSAWFRVIYSAGRIYPFWWDTQTHVYDPVTVAEARHHGLADVEQVTSTIARICRLHLFSTEIAIVPDGGFQVIDYVNDPIDLTPQSQTPNGVPDWLLGYIARDLADFVQQKITAPQLPEPPTG